MISCQFLLLLLLSVAASAVEVHRPRGVPLSSKCLQLNKNSQSCHLWSFVVIFSRAYFRRRFQRGLSWKLMHCLICWLHMTHFDTLLFFCLYKSYAVPIVFFSIFWEGFSFHFFNLVLCTFIRLRRWIHTHIINIWTVNQMHTLYLNIWIMTQRRSNNRFLCAWLDDSWINVLYQRAHPKLLFLQPFSFKQKILSAFPFYL